MSDTNTQTVNTNGAAPENPNKQSGNSPPKANGKTKGQPTQTQQANVGVPPSGYVRPKTHAQLSESVKNAPDDIVEGFISSRNIDALIGDSGLGKTPFGAQLGICIAAGIPFLDMRTTTAAVLYVDYENGGKGFDNLLKKLAKFLGLSEVPRTFRHTQDGAKAYVKYAIQELHAEFPDLPIVVILDTMRGYDSKMEGKNEAASDAISELRDYARKHNGSVLLKHHIRKHGSDKGEQVTNPLFNADIMEWLEQASGARALINQSTIRIGFDKHVTGDAEIVIKGHTKLSGPFGPILLKKVLDEDGEAIGWVRVSGVHLISSTNGERAAFLSFSDEFTFKQVLEKAGNTNKTTAWIKGWIGLSVVEKVGQTKSKGTFYRKTSTGKAVPKAAPKKDTQKPITKDVLHDIVKHWMPCTKFNRSHLGLSLQARDFGDPADKLLDRLVQECVAEGWLGYHDGSYWKVADPCR
jgi:hypothetical protein